MEEKENCWNCGEEDELQLFILIEEHNNDITNIRSKKRLCKDCSSRVCIIVRRKELT